MHSLRRRSCALMVPLVALLAACAPSGINYVRSDDVGGTDAHLFLKLPRDWKLFEEEDFLSRRSEDLSEEEIQALRDRQWLVIFDADPNPSMEHLAPDADHPAGFAQIRLLSQTEANYSLESLESEVFPYSQLRFQDGFELRGHSVLKGLPGELEGVKLRYLFDLEGTPVMVTQVGALDRANRMIYLTVVACKQSCYEDEKRAIERLISSWTVEGGL